MKNEIVRAAHTREPPPRAGSAEHPSPAGEPSAGRELSHPRGTAMVAWFISLDNHGGLLTVQAGDQEFALELHIALAEDGSRAWWFDSEGDLIHVAWLAKC